jgi:CRISPR-associated endoribonuclease Cas6
LAASGLDKASARDVKEIIARSARWITLLRIGYACGFGDRNSQGFGMVEVDRGVLGEELVMHLKARSAVLRLMGPNEKELAVGAIRLE